MITWWYFLKFLFSWCTNTLSVVVNDLPVFWHRSSTCSFLLSGNQNLNRSWNKVAKLWKCCRLAGRHLGVRVLSIPSSFSLIFNSCRKSFLLPTSWGEHWQRLCEIFWKNHWASTTVLYHTIVRIIIISHQTTVGYKSFPSHYPSYCTDFHASFYQVQYA